MGNASGHSGTKICRTCRKPRKKEDLNALMRAARNGHPECVRACIRAADLTEGLIDDVSIEYKTALTLAARNGHYECVDLIVRAGAHVNIPTKFPPLLEAAKKGHYECVEILMESGTNVDQRCGNFSDLVCLARRDQEQSADILMFVGADMSFVLSIGQAALVAAVTEGYVKCVIALVGAGVDVNINPRCFSSTLMVAAAAGAGSFSCMKVLLTLGVRVNVENVDGKNGMQICIAQSRASTKEKCLLLFAAGERIDLTTESFTFLGERRLMPVYLKHLDEKLCLKHLCRKTIRKHLITLNPHLNLFDRIFQLRQPHLLTSFLMYGMSLD